MDLALLKQLDDYRWTIPLKINDKRVDVVFYGSRELITAMDDKVREQLLNVATLPGLVSPAITMPDAHWGYGFPIGGVAAVDAEQGGVISAGGVGFDISCGIRCLKTDLSLQDILPKLEPLAHELSRSIPAGMGKGGRLSFSIAEIEDVLAGGAAWAVKKGYGLKEDLEYIEERGCIEGAMPDKVSEHAKRRQQGEMGTLGSGNHYCEVQVVEKIYDQEAARAFGLYEGQILISIHCGSRGLGHQIGTDYLKKFAEDAEKRGFRLPDPELACAPILSDVGQDYIGAMHAGINCALANRQILKQLVSQAVQYIIPDASLSTFYDVSHNTCKRERHLVDGKPKWVYVHRKGATRAFGPGHPDIPKRYRDVGQPVIIGGSMGTSSYVLVGNPETENHAFASSCHGAGRSMSRHQALKHWHGKTVVKELAANGILIRSRSMRGVAEEAPGAYKDVNEVARATEKAKLARRVALLRPKICVKG